MLSILGNNETSKFYFKDASLLEIMKEKYELKVKKFFYTEYVECIKNVCANDEYSWTYYVNDEPMNLGVELYELRDEDLILVAYKKV